MQQTTNNDHLKVFTKRSKEYKRLKQFVTILNAMSNHLRFSIETIYFDMGSDWKYTTIIAHNPDEVGVLSRWQALNPKQQKTILNGDVSDWNTVIKELLSHKQNNQTINHTADTTKEQIYAVIQCLIENGVKESEADTVTEALYFIMKNENIKQCLENPI